jgi:hypothetical protein
MSGKMDALLSNSRVWRMFRTDAMKRITEKVTYAIGDHPNLRIFGGHPCNYCIDAVWEFSPRNSLLNKAHPERGGLFIAWLFQVASLPWPTVENG